MGETERTLLLCMAYPEYSQSYGATVCMAGITETGELRRIYPIPFENFREDDYHKRVWIEYEIQEKGDYRKESYKIDPETVTFGDELDYIDVRNILEERATTINELNARKEEDQTSLGFVKPTNISLTLDEDEDRAQYAQRFNEQQTLTGGAMPVEVIPYYLRYHFNCEPECHVTDQHSILCEDIEIGQLYRNLRYKHRDLSTVEAKLQEKFVDWMVEKRDLYFMMGTHFQYGKWLIISVLYPEARQDVDLNNFF